MGELQLRPLNVIQLLRQISVGNTLLAQYYLSSIYNIDK